MTSRIAVLGGDARELRIAECLLGLGYEVSIFGLEKLPRTNPSVPFSKSLEDALDGVAWIVCPAPGVDGDKLYAPFAQGDVVLDRAALENSSVSQGGLIMGRASQTVLEAQRNMGFALIESKDERHLAIANSTSVAEGLLRLLIEKTDRVLRELKICVVGYGVTGAAFVDALVAMKCQPMVTTRSKVSLERARQCGATPVRFEDRFSAFNDCDIVINTAPDISTIPPESYPHLEHAMVVDIASPPGGMNHDQAKSAGINVVWARGLGSRAPLSSGDIRFHYVAEVLRAHGV